MELQVPTDFMSTYAWIFIAVSIIAMVGVGAALSWPSAPAMEHSCSIVSGFACMSAALGSYPGGSALFLRITNRQGAYVYMPGNSVIVHPYLNDTSYNGSCVPETVANGGSLLCVAYMNGYEPGYGASVGPGFSIVFGICGGKCSSADLGYQVSGTTYITAGESMQQAANATA